MDIVTVVIVIVIITANILFKKKYSKNTFRKSIAKLYQNSFPKSIKMCQSITNIFAILFLKVY